MKRILIVEDDRILSFLLEKQVKRLGYEVIGRISSGEGAISAAREQQPDCILMDINLEGGVDGIETMKTILAFSQVPFLYLTGNSDAMTRNRAMETSPIDYLIKPISMDSLGKALMAVKPNLTNHE